ncbi:hypothetical protein GR223_05270 [Rhizobium leguminosarum]|uniref:hypothetical protein n=1 Tax=Rhizobium TaxID=379 RepID=UPI00103A7E3D|nr:MULTISPECIES: hypothetical protein [Rhizobium]NEJ85362.1 hypothetical protein [Rhizobium ruizarguesonis]TCA58071.1 hypothetical protein E0H71_00265 [Rhizobium leguminosarum bv. viciae]
MAKDLGFNKGKLDLSGFEPRKSQQDPEDREASEKAADRAGFVSREPVERLTRRRKNDEPFDTAYIRAPISVINKLKTYCNDTGMSYGEALAELMRKAGL